MPVTTSRKKRAKRSAEKNIELEHKPLIIRELIIQAATSGPAATPLPRNIALWFGAAILAAMACALYAPVAQKFLNVFSDHTLHVRMAEQLYSTHHLPTPHFLYQALIAALVSVFPAMS